MRIIDQNIWTDSKWRKQIKDITERYFWFYLLTCPFSKSCGIFYLPIENICMDTKLTEEQVEKYIKKLTAHGLIKYNNDTEEILIYNYPRYNIIRLGKPMEDCINKELSLVKDKKLIESMITYLEQYISNSVNSKKNNILTSIISIYKTTININTNTSTNSDTSNDSYDWEKMFNIT